MRTMFLGTLIQPRTHMKGLLPALVAVLLVGCASPTASVEERGVAWAPLRLSVDEVEGYATVAEMKAAADVVAVGKFTSFDVSRTVLGDAPGDEVGYGVATLEISKILRGKAPDGPVPVEFLLPGVPATFEKTARGIDADLPSQDLLIFLRAKRGKGESGLYRLVNTYGMFTATERSAVDTPVSDLEFGPAYADELRDIHTLARLVEYVESL